MKNCLSLRFLIGGAVAGFWTYDLFLCVLVHEIDYICIFFGSRSYQKTKMNYRPSVTHPTNDVCSRKRLKTLFLAHFGPFLPKFGPQHFFFENRATSLFSTPWTLTSCKKAKKTYGWKYENFCYRQTDGQTDRQTDRHTELIL